MVRSISFIVQGVLVAILGGMGVLATQSSGNLTAAQAVAQAHFADAIIAVTLLIIVATVILGVVDHREREKDRKEREQHNRYIAEMHAKDFPTKAEGAPVATGQLSVTLEPASLSAAATVTNPSIADEVKAGRPLVRFQWENITTLRAAGLHLAKLYRDFANNPISEETIKSGKYMNDFWAQFPFGELGALKDRLQDILGFSVTSGAEELPSRPGRIRLLAKNLEKEARQVDSDIPL